MADKVTKPLKQGKVKGNEKKLAVEIPGVSGTTAEIVGPVAGFVMLALVAIWMLVALLRNVAGLGQKARTPES